MEICIKWKVPESHLDGMAKVLIIPGMHFRLVCQDMARRKVRELLGDCACVLGSFGLPGFVVLFWRWLTGLSMTFTMLEVLCEVQACRA